MARGFYVLPCSGIQKEEDAIGIFRLFIRLQHRLLERCSFSSSFLISATS